MTFGKTSAEIKAMKGHFTRELRAAAEGRGMVDGLFKWLDSTDFYKAPASTRFHGAYPGGLLEHSIAVRNRFMAMVSAEKLEVSFESATLCGLLHDLCKCNLYKERKTPGYMGAAYDFVEEFPLGHGEKSLSLVQDYLDLTRQEKLIIRWHMGPAWSKDEKTYHQVTEKFPEVGFFHCADYMDNLVKRVRP